MQYMCCCRVSENLGTLFIRGGRLGMGPTFYFSLYLFFLTFSWATNTFLWASLSDWVKIHVTPFTVNNLQPSNSTEMRVITKQTAVFSGKMQNLRTNCIIIRTWVHDSNPPCYRKPTKYNYPTHRTSHTHRCTHHSTHTASFSNMCMTIFLSELYTAALAGWTSLYLKKTSPFMFKS